MQTEVMQKLLKLVVITQEEEIDCGQCFKLLDIFADLTLQGEDAEKYYPMVTHHLKLCAGCREEFEAFMGSLRANS